MRHNLIYDLRFTNYEFNYFALVTRYDYFFTISPFRYFAIFYSPAHKIANSPANMGDVTVFVSRFFQQVWLFPKK